MEVVGLICVLVLLTGGGVIAYNRSRRQLHVTLHELTTLQERGAQLVATSSSSDSVPPLNEERRTQTAREQRELFLREREAQHLCRYCDERATHQYPAFKPVRPWFDALLRYFNATPNNRWTIELVRGETVPCSLCAKHHEWQLGYFEEMVAQERAKNSKFAADQRLLMYEFERYGSDERALDEMQSIRRGNRKRVAASKPDAPVIAIASRKRVENG